MDEARANDPEGAELLQAQSRAVFAAQALGKSHALDQLFRFLVATTLEGRTPKEFEIADEVFGRSADSIDQDSSIRVHIHRLRRKLDEFYDRQGLAEPARLIVPKGEYRLVVERREPAPVIAVATVPIERHRSRWAVFLMIAVAAGAIGWLIGQGKSQIDGGLAEVRRSALWQPLLTGPQRTAIVVGDYYIFGERDAEGEVTRLVREFEVSSRDDLERLVQDQPERAKNYIDLGLDYLPVGAGNAIRSIAPILSSAGGGAAPGLVVPASQLSPERIKYSNLAYLGYISGLGPLRDPLFNGSRFTVGASYDEVIDRKTGSRYVASTHLDPADDSPGQDFALVASFKGVTGNRIIVIAGTRDAALMQAAEFVSRPDTLAQLTPYLQSDQGFEALLGIETMHNIGLKANLIAASVRRRNADWSGRSTREWPDHLIKNGVDASFR